MDALDFDLKEIFDDDNEGEKENDDDPELSTPKLKAIADQPKKGKPLRKPQPKLDPQKLISEKGILQLPKLFEDVKLEGKGHEPDDLKRILQTYELWAYRLFPKMTFDDFIEKAEKLGEKREVKTCLKRLRMGVNNDDSVDKSDEEMKEKDEFEMDIPFAKAIPDDDFWSDSTARNTEDANHPIMQQILMPPPATVPTSITEDQMDRMSRNRALALERKRKKDRELAGLNPYEETPTQCHTIQNSVSTMDIFDGGLPLEIDEPMVTEDEILSTLGGSAIPEETQNE